VKDKGKNLVRLGITGGIGSGKSTVCKVFNVLGIPVFYADDAARDIINNNYEIACSINKVAGGGVLSGNVIDRKKLAGLIFNNNALLEDINSIVHPVVFKCFEEWVNKQQSAYVILEAAILIESGASKFVDSIITVIAPTEERIRRVVQRNSLSREQVMERINNQMDDATRIKMSDFVIDNSENKMIIPVILKIHHEILNKIQS
jgi:dephospho-CoA kinase